MLFFQNSELAQLKLPSLKLITGVFSALFVLSACGGTDPSKPNVSTDHIVDATEPTYQTPDNLATFETAEYKQSKALESVKAAYAYGNIDALIKADEEKDGVGVGNSDIKQAGEDQVVSIVTDSYFATNHAEFKKGATDAAIFASIYNLTLDEEYTGGALATDTAYDTTYPYKPSGGGANCTESFPNRCYATHNAALIAGNKDDEDADTMHGIAYNATVKGFIIDSSVEANLTAHLIKSLAPSVAGVAKGGGVSADIIAMNHAWTDETTSACNEYNILYTRPKGKDIRACDDTLSDSTLTSAELTAWRDAVSTTDSDSSAADIQTPNNTIMVFATGDNGFNSENGRVNGEPVALLTGSTIYDVADSNIPAFRAAYPALHDESAGKDQIKDNADDAMGLDGIEGNDDDDDADFKSDRWLAVTALGENGAILNTANGCGVAMYFCLAAPGGKVYVANRDYSATSEYETFSGTGHASSTVAGALAVLKGAFPKATPEQLARLVLDTATYIKLDGRTTGGGAFKVETHNRTFGEDFINRKKVLRADGTARWINPVYGYGLLNLAAATTPSLTSYVTTSNNESIGVLWQDTSLTLSSHFGGNFEPVTFGIGDVYGRHFTTNAPQVSHTPVAVDLDDYMSNLLGDNVQSERLGPQAQVNYANTGNQNWMNFQYISGKATSKISFQDSYKISPLNDTGATTILRANHIRPASTNIGMMDVDYTLDYGVGKNLTLSSYVARGEYDTGYRFDELGTDIDLRHKKSTLNLGLGNIREHQQFLGTNTSGAYAVSAPSISQFTDVTYGHDVGTKFNIYANYINYKTDVEMGYQDFASIDNLQADQYQIGFKGRNLLSDDDGLNVALITKLGVTDGALNQNTVRGYTADGDYNNVTQSYDLAVQQRHQQLELTYQGKLYQNADKVSALKDNRFFTTIRVDQNLNHVQGAGQTEIVSGINARF